MNPHKWDLQKSVGERIRILRLKKGISQEQLALSSNVNVSYMSQLERGQGNATVETLRKIASALDINIVDLFIEAEHSQLYSGSKNQKAIVTVFSSDDLKQLITDALKSNVPETKASGKDNK